MIYHLSIVSILVDAFVPLFTVNYSMEVNFLKEDFTVSVYIPNNAALLPKVYNFFCFLGCSWSPI